MVAVYKREMRAYFSSPIGYIFVALFMAVSAWFFMSYTLQQGENSNFGTYFQMIIVLFVAILPLLTMKLFSEERKQRTEQLLLTHAALPDVEVVAGVDIDEEAMNLAKYQEAYNLAAKVIAVMSETYDTLINTVR